LKVLIIRFSSIGDIVLTTPVIRCLKQQLENAEIHYITKPQFKEVLSGNPYIDKLLTLKEDLLDTLKELRKVKYDLIIDLHHNQRSLIIKQALRANSRSFNKLNLQKWLMVNLKLNKLSSHIVDRYLETVKPLGIINDGKGLDHFITKDDIVISEELPSTHRNGYVGWVIGAVHNTKKLPVNKIISVCKKISQPIVLIGGKLEYNDGEKISHETGTKVFNACGKFSINQSASLVQQASLIISNDTGLMHIAAAFKKQIISLWGNTVPKFGMSPYYGNSTVNSQTVEVNGLDCRPCSKIGYKQCPKKHFKCMEMIDENRIVEFTEVC